jgi:hypothetical protein
MSLRCGGPTWLIKVGWCGAGLTRARGMMPRCAGWSSRLGRRRPICRAACGWAWTFTTHSRITGRFQPPGDSYYPSHMAGVSAGTGHPGDDRGLQPVDRVGADTQQARALGVQPGDGAGPLEYVVGIVHPRMDRRVPADMPSR